MTRFFLAVLLWTLALSPVPAEATTAAEDTVVCDKATSADVIVVAIRTSSGYKYACANGANGGGVTQGDVDFVVRDFTDTPDKRQWAFGTSEAPSGVWYAVHRVGEPLGQRLKMVKVR